MSGYDPDDLRTHGRAWRRALEIARDSCRLPSGADDRSYWEHEIKVFDRTMKGLLGGLDGAPITDVKLVRGIPSEPARHPDGPGKWWGEFNPWHWEAIYVPVEELAAALGHERVPVQWLSHSARLDGYLLRQPGGEYLVGVRYGSDGGEYLTPAAFAPAQQEALRALAESAERRWRSQAPRGATPPSGARSPRGRRVPKCGQAEPWRSEFWTTELAFTASLPVEA